MEAFQHSRTQRLDPKQHHIGFGRLCGFDQGFTGGIRRGAQQRDSVVSLEIRFVGASQNLLLLSQKQSDISAFLGGLPMVISGRT